MPTIDQLDLAVVASDDDVLLVSQGGAARRVTRAQVLAGTQTAMSLTPGLLGRTTVGLGPPEQVLVGGGLRLANGVLSSPSQFSVSALPSSTVVSAGDLLPVSQGGQDRSLPVSALLSLTGIDVSGQVARAGSTTRRLADWFGDGLSAAAFGAVGDGVTDDTAALTRAVASGHPVLLGPTTYRLDGQWSISLPTVLVGVPGQTVLRRTVQSGGAWISIDAPTFAATGVIFDAGKLTGDSWGVLVNPTCTRTHFEDCSFVNVMGANLGTGLVIQARDGLIGHGSRHLVQGCVFANNAVHGLWVQAAAGALIESCSAYQNGKYGICLDFNDPQFKEVVRQSTVIGCRCWSNERGISIGNYNQTNLEPPVWGLANPDALDIIVTSNVCVDNLDYGIAVSGLRIQVSQNQVVIQDQASAASGILSNASSSRIANNSVCGPGQFGIDAGGSSECEIIGNIIMSCKVGINAGGSQSLRLAENRLLDNARGITIFQVETDGRGQNFGIACNDISIIGNSVNIPTGGGGIYILDASQQIVVAGNSISYTAPTIPANLLWAHTDAIEISGNWVNGALSTPISSLSGASQDLLQFPDIIDRVTTTTAIQTVSSLAGVHQAQVADEVCFVKVLNGGTGYTQASVSISGAGTGATAQAYVINGSVIGIAIISGGSAYVQGSTLVAILGDGQGASAVACVGLPVPVNRRMILQCLGAVQFKFGGPTPSLGNWTCRDITVASNTEVMWSGVAGGWQAVSFTNTDYLLPANDGSVLLQSVSGDVKLRPSSGGQVRITSVADPSGFTISLGHGSPEGVIVAPPGSDYRNLDGGIGSTLWLKQSGVNSTGWAAIA